MAYGSRAAVEVTGHGDAVNLDAVSENDSITVDSNASGGSFTAGGTEERIIDAEHS